MCPQADGIERRRSRLSLLEEELRLGGYLRFPEMGSWSV